METDARTTATAIGSNEIAVPPFNIEWSERPYYEEFDVYTGKYVRVPDSKVAPPGNDIPLH
jgi:hypothetical protein